MLENKATLQTKRFKTLLAERRSLLDLLHTNIPSLSAINTEDEEDLDVQLIADMWAEHVKLKAEKNEEVRKAHIKAMEARFQLEIDALLAKLNVAENGDKEAVDGLGSSDAIPRDQSAEVISLTLELKVLKMINTLRKINSIVLYVLKGV